MGAQGWLEISSARTLPSTLPQHTMAGAGDSKKLIDSLLQAEKQAEEIIATAKKNRLSKLREAKAAADEELEAFKATQEESFQKSVGAKAKVDPAAELKATTEAELRLVEQDFANNSKKTIDYVVQKVLDVPLRLSSTQKQALKAGV